jgi:hypothetical protein
LRFCCQSFGYNKEKEKKEKRPSIVYTEKQGPIHGPNLVKPMAPELYPGLGFRVFPV